MTSLRAALCAITLLLVSAPAFANFSIAIECSADQSEFLFSVELFNQYFQESDPAGWEFILVQTWVGTCDDPAIVHAFTAPEPFSWTHHEFSVPVPAVDQNFRYEFELRGPDGTVRMINMPGAPSYRTVACGNPPEARGFLVDPDDLGYFDLAPCPDACGSWTCTRHIDLSGVPVEQWLPYLLEGTPVDIDGYEVLYPMPGDPCLVALAVTPTAAGYCGIVAAERESWGSLKARYR